MGKRGTLCTICQHEKRHGIELGIVHRISHAVLAQRFECSKHAVTRHARHHLSPVQRAALLSATKPQAIDLAALQASESEGLLAQLVAQRARLQGHAEQAAELGDVRGAVSAEGAITANLSLVGKLLGQLVQRYDVRHSSILISPDYLKLRATLVTALRPFPEAGRAVAAALHALESDAAKEIEQAARPGPKVIEHAPTPPVAPLPPPPPAAAPPPPPL